MRVAFSIIGGFIILFGISFSMLNSGKVLLHYYLGSWEVSLSILLAAALGIGFCLGVFFSLISWIRLKKENIALKHQLKLTQ